MQFAILPLTPFHIALLLEAQPILLTPLCLLLLLLLGQSILLEALLFASSFFLALLLLALLPLAVAFLALTNSLFGALPLFLLLPRALIIGLGPALHLDLIPARVPLLARLLSVALLPALWVAEGWGSQKQEQNCCARNFVLHLHDLASLQLAGPAATLRWMRKSP
ncbi:MAG: hypothetical protein M1453_08035 [Acidobacteria bacterium]|nr:hypothetical protein [Acidobacteriota bacterium]MCL5287926.1 hypothetical protein [Acidobacteriota bacterium]